MVEGIPIGQILAANPVGAINQFARSSRWSKMYANALLDLSERVVAARAPFKQPVQRPTVNSNLCREALF